MGLPDRAGVVLDAVYVESVMGGYASVRDTWAHSQDLLVATDAAVQANWTVKVTGQMTTIDGQRVLIASAVQLYVTVDGSPAPPFPPYLLAGMAGISLIDIPPMPAQRGIGVPMNTLETTSESAQAWGSIASAKGVGGTGTLTGKVVTAVFHDVNGLVSFFYIQEPGTGGAPGIYGIKVVPGHAVPVEPGNVVELADCTVVPSSLTSTPAVAECYITAPSVKCVGSHPVPKALGLNQRTAAGGQLGLQQALYSGTGWDLTPGIGIVGTRVRVWGKVTYSDTGNHCCWLDDGSGLEYTVSAGPPVVKRSGVHVIYEAADPPGLNEMVAGVTGILGAEMDGDGHAVPVLRVPEDAPTSDEVICVRPYPDGIDSHSGRGWTTRLPLSRQRSHWRPMEMRYGLPPEHTMGRSLSTRALPFMEGLRVMKRTAGSATGRRTCRCWMHRYTCPMTPGRRSSRLL